MVLEAVGQRSGVVGGNVGILEAVQHEEGSAVETLRGRGYRFSIPRTQGA